jgi:hypothetical protein
MSRKDVICEKHAGGRELKALREHVEALRSTGACV